MPSEEDIFQAALALPLERRLSLLDEACADQPALRERVEALLRAHDAAGFMDDRTTPPVEAMEGVGERSGDRIGRYRLLEAIGEGGFGVVWMAEQVEPVTRRVALKILKAGMDSKEVIARFEAERQALARMDHPNIASVHDAGTTDNGRPYFVMELVKGIPITRFCDDHRLTTRERLRLFTDVCAAVSHAHQKGVIHRDLKPTNVLVTLHADRPLVKVIDFGIAKAIEGRLTEHTLFTRFAQFVGTPAYMSPEQAALSDRDVDTRSDIYALGVLLYELLTGTPPFDTRTLVAAGYDEMRRILREVEPEKPSTRLARTLAATSTSDGPRSKNQSPKSKILPDLDWIVMKAIEKDRDRRYETANGLKADVDRFLADEPVSAGPPTARYRFHKFARRHRTAFRVAASLAAVLVTATVVSTLLAFRAFHAEKDAHEKAAGEKSAREEAEAISRFLTHILESPDPAYDGRTVTVVQILDRAAAELESTLTIPPERQARLLLTLGTTYSALGLHEEALKVLGNARTKLEARLGPSHHLTLSALGSMAAAFNGLERTSEAAALYQEMLWRSRAAYGEEHPDTLLARNGVAVILANSSDADDVLRARQEYEALLSLSARVHGPKHPATLMVMNNLAMAYRSTGQIESATKTWEELLPLDREVNGLNDPGTLRTMNNLAVAYHDTGRSQDALALRQQVTEIRRERFGSDHPDTLNAMNNLAVSLAEAGEYDEAIRLLEEVIATGRRMLPSGHTTTTDAMANLARSYAEGNRPDDAIRILKDLVAIRRESAHQGHSPELLEALNQLSDSYYDAGRFQDEMKVLREIIGLQQRSPGPEHPATIRTLLNLGISQASTGQQEDAVRTLEDAVARCRKSPDSDPQLTVDALHNLSRAYRESGRRSDAITLQEEAVPLSRIAYGDDDETTLNAIHSLAFLYAADDRWADAQPLQEEFVDKLREKLEPGDPNLQEQLRFMAEIFDEAGLPDRAAALREEVTGSANNPQNQRKGP